MKIFLIGYPGGMGGANTEAWHTLRLWREAGWDVTAIPTWRQDDRMRPKLDAIGVKTVEVERVKPNDPAERGTRPKLQDVPGLAGSICVGMCNQHALGALDELRAMGCKLIWLSCMTYIQECEHRGFIDHGPADAYLFQSQFQRDKLEPKLRKYGYDAEQGFLIRGAFYPDEYEFKPLPHSPGKAFYVGKLARPQPTKWSKNHWNILAGIPYAERRALCMGWDEQTQHKCGRPPSWAECLPPQEVTSQEFLARCHCLLLVNGGDFENWPRVGLEAMAAGVPLVVENRWGWKEMIRHGFNGYLCDTEAEMAYQTARLAYTGIRRTMLAENARESCTKLSDPAKLIPQWQKMLDFVQARTFRKPELRI
jgi:hypothetical protein